MDKKEAILFSALKLLASQGVHATPVSAIAKEAGTGMGTIYNYFPTKDILINSLYVKIKYEEKSQLVSFDPKSSIKNQFEDYYRSTIKFFLKNPLYFHFMEQLHASPIITQESKEYGDEAIIEVSKLIKKGKKDGLFKNLKNDELMQFIGGTVLSFLRLHHQSTTTKEIALKNQLKMVWDAIKM